MQTLRPYQETAVDAIQAEWESGITSTLGVAATGTGKTTIIAEIVRRSQPLRTMIVAHREELIFQCAHRIEEHAHLNAEIEMGESVATTNLFHRTPVVIATVQTLVSGNGTKRVERFDPMEFGRLIIDEFHHATAPSYRIIIDHFKKNPEIKILGVTATPDRADESALGQIAESVAFDYDILDAINDGWLVPVEQQMVSIQDLDFSQIRTTAGDLNGADLAAVMESEKTLQGMCGAAIQIIGEKRSIVFTVTVKHAEMSCEILNRHRPKMAEWICGKTPKEERRKIMKRFSSGETQVLCNVGCLTEGVDVPAAEIVIMARPTKSRSLYTQMAGRILRALPGVVDGPPTPGDRKAAILASAKPCALIVDFCGNSGRHKLMTSADILGGKTDDEILELAKEKAKDGNRKPTQELLDEATKEIEDRKQREEARRARLVAKVKYTARIISPFEAFDITPARERGWDDGKTLSEKQRSIFSRMGVDPDSMPYGQAKQILNAQFDRWKKGYCTFKQAKTLKRYGVETATLSMKDASSMMDQLAKNGWRKPESWGG